MKYVTSCLFICFSLFSQIAMAQPSMSLHNPTAKIILYKLSTAKGEMLNTGYIDANTTLHINIFIQKADPLYLLDRLNRQDSGRVGYPVKVWLGKPINATKELYILENGSYDLTVTKTKKSRSHNPYSKPAYYIYDFDIDG